MWIDKNEKTVAGQRSLFLPKAAWFRDERPGEYEKTRVFLPCPEYLSFLLSGEEFAVSPSGEFSEYLWTGKSLESFGLDAGKFPAIVPPGTKTGAVTAAASRRFGLPAGMPVYSGGPDFLMSLLGTAATRPGRVCDRAGTSEGINYCAEKPVVSKKVRCLPHIVPGCYNIAGILSSTGRLFEWFRRLSGQDRTSYEAMLGAMQEISGSRGFSRPDLPWFFPSLHEGAAWEFSKGMFIGLGADHGKNEMGLSVVESIGFAVRHAVQILEEHGCVIGELRISGGQAKNPVWNRMKADMVGKTLLVPEIQDAELLGDLAAGLCGRGDYERLDEAAEDLVRFTAEYRPDRKNYARYTGIYEQYLHAYSRFQNALKGC
jgi:xylulokinase